LTKDTVAKPVCHGGKKPVLFVVFGAGQPVLFISRPFTVMWTFPGSDGDATETLISPPDKVAGVTVNAIGGGEAVVLGSLEEPVVLDPLEVPATLVSFSAGPAQPASR